MNPNPYKPSNLPLAQQIAEIDRQLASIAACLAPTLRRVRRIQEAAP